MQLFKFSNACLESLNKGLMFVVGARNGHKIFWSVIVSNAIKVVNNPSIGNSPVIKFLPYQYMLQNISKIISSWVLRAEEGNISIPNLSSPIPFPVFLSYRGVIGRWVKFMSKSCRLSTCPKFQPPALKQLPNSSFSPTNGITQGETHLVGSHFSFPIHFHKLFVSNVDGFVCVFTHKSIIPYNILNLKGGMLSRFA